MMLDSKHPQILVCSMKCLTPEEKLQITSISTFYLWQDPISKINELED